MDKIYSRKRFIIKPIGRFCGKNANLKNIKFAKKIIKFISIILIGVYGFKIGFDYLEPVYEAMCNEKVKYTATIITNQQSTIVMNQYKYEELYTIEKDSNGNVSAIKSNVAVVNNIISDLTEKIQQEFEKIPTEKIYITLGNLTGNYLLSGFGPRIPIKISMTGSVDTEIKSVTESTSNEDNINYSIKTKKDNNYIISENIPMNFTIQLDEYTIVLDSFKEKYNSAKIVTKITTDVDKVMKMINTYDYINLYNILDESYKNENFSEINSFISYITSELYNSNIYEIKNVKVQGDNYIAEITLYENNENDSNTNNMKIIIQLLDGTNFKILFQN